MWAAVAALLLVQAAEIVTVVRQESLTFDEDDHIFAGYEMWKTGDYGLNPEHPPLVKLLATSVILGESLQIPPNKGRFFKEEAYLDGRDFLYTVFQMGNPERARPIVERLFGSAILRYADRAWATKRGDHQRIAICDLAVQDDDVIHAHAKNTMVIGGRYDTQFCSAFMVRMPIPSERIVSVEQVSARDFAFPDPGISSLFAWPRTIPDL